MNYTDDQKNAANVFLAFIADPDEKFMVLQGDAGTGKTTGMQHFLEALEAKRKLLKTVAGKDDINKWDVQLLATTNQATNVLTSLSKTIATTVHSHFGLAPRYDYTNGEVSFVPSRNTVDRFQELIIIDESSFLDDYVLGIVDKFTPGCKIVLVGDYWQLAPVNSKSCAMQRVKTKYKAVLSQIVRHGGDIASAGKHYRDLIPTSLFTPYTFNSTALELCEGTEFRGHIDRIFENPDYKPEHGRVLAWTNDRVNQFNTLIRQIRNMDPLIQEGELVLTNKPILSRKKTTFAATDTFVRMGAAREEVREGVKGREVRFNATGAGEAVGFLPNNQLDAKMLMKKLKMKKQWKDYYRIKESWLDLRSPFASTVHKSQGSSFNEVCMDLYDIGKCNSHSDVARMMYVGITRAAHKVNAYGNLPTKYGGIIDGHSAAQTASIPAEAIA